MLQKGYGLGKGIFSSEDKNDSALSLYDYSKKSKQGRQKNNARDALSYPNLDDDGFNLTQSYGKNKHPKFCQLPVEKTSRKQQQVSDGQDDDDQDYHLLLNELEALNLSDVMPSNNGQQNEEVKNLDRKKLKEPQQFWQMLTELNRMEEKQQKDDLVSKLNQNEIKSLILGSYMNKIMSYNGFAGDLQSTVDYCEVGSRLPKYWKRTLLLFLQEVIEQVQLDASAFSVTKYKFKIEKAIPETISFGRNIESHFTKQKRSMMQNLINGYMKMDYIHAEAKKIFFRNVKKIIKFYKEYGQKTRPSKQPKQYSPPNQNTRATRSQASQLNSQITQSQDLDFEIKYPPLSKKSTQSTYNFKSEQDAQDLLEVRSQFAQVNKGSKKQENSKQSGHNQNVMKKNTNKVHDDWDDIFRQEYEKNRQKKSAPKLAEKQKQQPVVKQQKKLRDSESQTQHGAFKISQYSVDFGFNKAENILRFETAGNPTPLLSSSQYCKSIFGKSPPKNSQTRSKSREKSNNHDYRKTEVKPEQYSYISDNLSSDEEQEVPKQVLNNKRKPQQFFSPNTTNTKKIDNSKSNSFNLSLSSNTSNNPLQQIILRDQDQKRIQNCEKQVLVHTKLKQQQQNRESDDDVDFSSDSESSGNQYTNQLLDMTRVIDASLRENDKKIRVEDHEDSWDTAVLLSPIKDQRILKKALEEKKVQRQEIKKIQKQPNTRSIKLEQNTTNQSYRKLGSQLKQKLSLLAEQFEGNFIKYEKSKPEFHVGPRRQMFNFLDEICVSVSKIRASSIPIPVGNSRDKDEELGVKVYKHFSQDKIKELKEIFVKYNSIYFHQNIKMGMFGDVKTLIKFYKESK